jgi:putative membrane protein
MKFIIQFLLTSIFVFVLSHIIPGIHIADFLTAIIVALVFGLFNAILRPIILFLTLPLTLLTLGLFALVVNALLVILITVFVKGFVVDGFFSALLFSIVLSVLTSLVKFYFKKNRYTP